CAWSCNGTGKGFHFLCHKVPVLIFLKPQSFLPRLDYAQQLRLLVVRAQQTVTRDTASQLQFTFAVPQGTPCQDCSAFLMSAAWVTNV
ncbi:mCG141121, partial [Mus musculus]